MHASRLASEAESSSVPAGMPAEAAGTAAAQPAVAMVAGEPLRELPQDLYIPPDALEIFLDAFEGPLDLLLYLIKRQNIDILNIPIADITAQYMRYIELMENLRFELAAEYLVMAAVLAEIKSRMLLPRVDSADDDEDDPRAELIRRLQEYERFKQAAERLDELPRVERELHPLSVAPPALQTEQPQPDVSLAELLRALRDVTERARLAEHHQVIGEQLSVRARMSAVLGRLCAGELCEFSSCFTPEEGRGGVVVTFIAILELCREMLIELVQTEPFAPIYLKARNAVDCTTEAVALEFVTDLS